MGFEGGILIRDTRELALPVPLSCAWTKGRKKSSQWGGDHQASGPVPWSWISRLQNIKEINFCCLQIPMCGVCYSSLSRFILVCRARVQILSPTSQLCHLRQVTSWVIVLIHNFLTCKICITKGQRCGWMWVASCCLGLNFPSRHASPHTMANIGNK